MMKNYIYQNNLIGKKQLRQILGWSFTNYDSTQACTLADELKYLGFKYGTLAGISINIEDLRVPFIKNSMLEKANEEIINSEKLFLKGKITEVERFQKIIDTWSLTSESLKDQVINYFKKYDPLNSVYIMAFSGARGNLSQVRQLVGMRGLMSDPSGEILNLPIKHNFREGLTITDYLMSGYGARKGIVDTALKTANSGYLTRRLIDVSQDILIREKDCFTDYSILILKKSFSKKIIGRILNTSILDEKDFSLIAKKNAQITPLLFKTLKEKNISQFYIRSPLTCQLYRAICQQCYGWDLSTENLIDIGEAVGIIAGQSIGEPGTQLTMRTFHTGGIFTSEARQQIINPSNGIIRFSRFLKTVILRTNRGEDVLVTRNSGSLIVIPDLVTQPINKIEIARNTILFPKDKQYIQKDTLIGELIDSNKQIKREIKPILSYTSGEIIIPKLKTNQNKLNDNKLLWLLSGKLYNGPKNCYVNFYSDYKINKKSYIFRTKIVSSYSGKINYNNLKKNLYENQVLIKNNLHTFEKSKLQNLSKSVENFTSLFYFKNQKYLINARINNLEKFLKVTRKQKFAKLITPNYLTRTGGILFYNWKIIMRSRNLVSKVYFCDHKQNYGFIIKKEIEKKYELDFLPSNEIFENKCQNVFSKTLFRTLFWIEEEKHNLNCEQNVLLVKNGDFISKDFEIIPNLFVKTSGLVTIIQKSKLINSVIIRSGLIYEGKKISLKIKSKKFVKKLKKLFFPGEKIFSTITIESPSLCEQIIRNNTHQLLFRPIKFYEVPQVQKFKTQFKINNTQHFVYKPNQLIQTQNQLNLITKFLDFKMKLFSSYNVSIGIHNNDLTKTVNFNQINKLNLNHYILPNLKYDKLKCCSLTQTKQFIDLYSTLSYIEAVTKHLIEIVKFKVNKQEIKQILLISNDDCISIKKNQLNKKKKHNFIINSTNSNHVGKIIIENNKFFTLQKGRPYFFPKCKSKELHIESNLQYKIVPLKRLKKEKNKSIKLSVNSYNRLRVSVNTNPTSYFENSINSQFIKNKIKFPLKIEFSKIFLKQNGKLYSCLIPRFLKQFQVSSDFPNKIENSRIFLYPKRTELKLDKTLLINRLKKNLAFVKFMEYPFTKVTKSIGLYSVTQDLFEQELNSVFYDSNQFLENNDTIGLLNLEKEITGDIVQGLPRIEEILEARKKNQGIIRIPTSKKKGLLTQISSLNENFEFQKLGTPIKESEKINPHKLIKIYFNYYGFLKPFYSYNQKYIKYGRLVNNFEGTYKSFKKVQSFILNSVQGVYTSQGVTINNKHVEVIINQMTTKVLVTDEGNTPLLKREIIDLYHIQYINKIIEVEQRQPAYYLPLLFGITRAALNNPSFISAASFQETNKVLTKAAIEGRIDWLRGLKENIIIGHLIPSGTGSQNFKISFKKPLLNSFK